MRYLLHAVFLLFLTSLHADFYVIPVSKCPANMQMCEGVCTDTLNNPLHCGSCTSSCENGEVCSNGTCVISCQSGLTNCSDQCVNLQYDTQHCGSCPNACGADELCNQGTCLAVCQQETSLCPSGCVDLQTDPNNCGVCNTQCGTGEICQNGNCTASLPNGYTCSQGSECETGFCVDGVCCNTACDSGCYACSSDYTGGANGTCAPVLYGYPHDVCTEPSFCNGSGLCTN